MSNFDYYLIDISQAIHNQVVLKYDPKYPHSSISQDKQRIHFHHFIIFFQIYPEIRIIKYPIGIDHLYLSLFLHNKFVNLRILMNWCQYFKIHKNLDIDQLISTNLIYSNYTNKSILMNQILILELKLSELMQVYK